MRYTKRKILVALLFCAGFALVNSVKAVQQRPVDKPLSTWELIHKSQVKQAEPAEPESAGRVLHFPKERSLGQLMIRDSNVVRDIKTFHYWVRNSDWEYFGKAQGDVKIPKGKNVRLILYSWTWQNPQTLSVLKQLQPNDIYSLTLSPGWSPEGKSPSHECMPYVAHLRGLRVLNLAGADITSQGLKYITELKSLEQLYAPSGLTNEGLTEIVRLSTLKALYIKNHNLTNTDLAHLAKLPLLEELDLAGTGRVNDAGLAHLANAPHLRYLMLHGETFTDAGIAHLKNCPSLRILHFGYLKHLTDSAVIHLSQIPQLERISFHWNENITDAGIIHLIKLKSLSMLNIKRSKVTGEGFEHLAKIKTLENLTLPDAGVTDAGVDHIAQLENLRSLWAGSSPSSPLTDKSLQYISSLTKLEELHVHGAGLSDEGMKDIAKLKRLRQLSISSPKLTNIGLAELADLESLTKLSIGPNTGITTSGLKSLNSIKKLKRFSIRDIRRDDSVMDICGLAELENLTLALHWQSKDGSIVSNSFRNEDWACLANLTKLKNLQICGMGIDDGGIKHLSGLKNLEFLNIFCEHS